MADHGIDRPAPAEESCALHDQRHADAGIGQIAFHAGEGDAVVGGVDHERVIAEAALIKRTKYLPDFVIEDLRHGDVVRHVLSYARRIGQAGRRLHIGWIDIVLEGEFAMVLEETDCQPERLVRRRHDEVDGGVMRLIVVGRQNLVVADFLSAAMKRAALVRC